MRKREARNVRVNRIARKLARHWARLRESSGWGRTPLRRKERKGRLRRLIAYDLETTRIAEGTPRPLYFTAFGENFKVSEKIGSIADLLALLESRILTEEFNKARFVAWNANGFDVYFIGRALLESPDYIIRPFLTRSKNLRGMKVQLRGTKLSWEFLDATAMTIGNVPMTLKKFLEVMAPDFGKLEAPDWEREEFNADNPAHVAYAERDSEGLWRGIVKAQSVVIEHFNVGLQPTIGNTAIRIFQANMPEGLNCWEPGFKVSEIIRAFVMRGGFCHLQRQYCGPVWKYDLNQAYAAAMRDAQLPGGRVFHMRRCSGTPVCAIHRISAIHARGTAVPFYYVNMEGEQAYSDREIADTWITSEELKQLRAEGWKIEEREAYGWEEGFQMREYVQKLEYLRMNAPDGPGGSLGTMVKSIGNNSYGKTVEMLDGLELLLSKEKPEGFHEYQADDDLLSNVWFRFAEPHMREYHQPQIGAFITAHVRMVVRRAALANVAAFLYADTDCAVFDRAVKLPLDAKKYGFWKQEVAGDQYWLITKKVYGSHDGKTLHAKGLNVRRLSVADFAAWYAGRPPRQRQLQRNNWVKVMTGEPMFRVHEKDGQRLARPS